MLTLLGIALHLVHTAQYCSPCLDQPIPRSELRNRTHLYYSFPLGTQEHITDPTTSEARNHTSTPVPAAADSPPSLEKELASRAFLEREGAQSNGICLGLIYSKR